MTAHPAQHRLRLVLAFSRLALRKLQPPCQAGEIAHQAHLLVGTQPEHAVWILGAMPIGILPSELCLADTSEPMDGDSGAARQHPPQQCEFVLASNEVRREQ